jgi:hypothetical protein
MNEGYVNPYEDWNILAAEISYGLWAVTFLIVLGYMVKLAMTGDAKAKYDFINKNEIRVLWIASIFFILGGCFWGNSNVEVVNPLMVFVRIFVSVCVGMIAALIIQNLLKFYYPFFIERRLKKLRYTPRISPKTGKPMKLLSEEEEDVHLDEGMRAEENVFSVDYDVWKDEETGFVKIEKYAGHLHAIQCPECNYQTFKVVREEILKTPTPTEEGELLKHYLCGYCGYKAKKTVVLKSSAKLQDQAGAA